MLEKAENVYGTRIVPGSRHDCCDGDHDPGRGPMTRVCKQRERWGWKECDGIQKVKSIVKTFES